MELKEQKREWEGVTAEGNEAVVRRQGEDENACWAWGQEQRLWGWEVSRMAKDGECGKKQEAGRMGLIVMLQHLAW